MYKRKKMTVQHKVFVALRTLILAYPYVVVHQSRSYIVSVQNRCQMWLLAMKRVHFFNSRLDTIILSSSQNTLYWTK